MMEWRIKMMTKEEDLNPKLKKYVDRSSSPFGSLLRHPLLVTEVYPKHAAWINWCVEHKEKELAKFRAAGDWRGVLSCYERPFLVEGFCNELADCDDASYGNCWHLSGLCPSNFGRTTNCSFDSSTLPVLSEKS